MCILGIMFIITGNYTTKIVGHTDFYWIKEETLKKKLLKVSAYFIILDGFLFIFSILFESIVSVIMVALVILEIILLYVYAFIKNRS